MLLSNKRNILNVILLLTLLSTVLGGMLFVRKANANPMSTFFSNKIYSNDFHTRVIVKSPSHEAAYPSNIIPFSVVVVASKNWQLTSVKLVLYLDNLPVKIVFSERGKYEQDGFFVDHNFIHANSSIRVKEEGLHSLIVYAIVGYSGSHVGSGQSGVVPFTVKNTAPQLEIISIENKTYATSDVPLYFLVNKPVSKFAYSLDGQDTVTVLGNSTLSGISNGEHQITMFSWDEVGNLGASEPVIFNIAIPESESEPFPTTLVGIVIIASTAIISFGLVAYFVRRDLRRSE